MTSRFERDTAVSAAGGGSYDATIDPSWWILRGPNGGYLAAIVARAVVAEVAEPDQRLRSLTLHYLRAPVEGPCRVEVAIERRGRTLTSVTFRLLQDDVVHIVGVAATAADRTGPEFSDLPMPDVAEPADPTPPPPDVPAGSPDIPMRRHYEIQTRLGPDRYNGEISDHALTGGWIRFADPSPIDDIALAAISDAWTPAVFARVPEPLGVPTVDLTIHFRDRPTGEPGWTFARFRSQHAAAGYVEEDGELWSADGRLLVQSRQLAVAMPLV